VTVAGPVVGVLKNLTKVFNVLGGAGQEELLLNELQPAQTKTLEVMKGMSTRRPGLGFSATARRVRPTAHLPRNGQGSEP